ncbi:hypothetical protein GCM10010203_56460 [Actinomadura yumaensis]
MAGVGQESGGIRDQPGREFADHKGQIDRQADGVAPVSCVHGAMGVPVAVMVMMTSPVRVVMTVVRMIMVVIMVVVGGGAFGLGCHGSRLYANSANSEAAT